MVTSVREDQSRTQRKNVIINGNFDIWQRGTSFPGLSTGATSTADRWRLDIVSSGIWTITRDTSVPPGVNASFSHKATVTTADATVNVGDEAHWVQRVEGYNFFPLYQRSFTLTFWVKSNVTGIFNVSVANFGPDRSYVVPFTINVPDTWEFKTITVTAIPTGGTWNFTNDIGLRVRFTVVAGTTWQTTPNAWQTGNFLSSAGQVNLASTIGNYIQTTQVQLERGATPSLIEARAFSEELALCQRYYEKSYNVDVNPGTITEEGMVHREVVGNFINISTDFKITKRTNPTVVVISTASGTSARIFDGAMDIVVTGFSGIGQNSIGGINIPTFAGNQARFHYTADAEL